MSNKLSRYIMTLVALFAMTTGIWAQTFGVTDFKASDITAWSDDVTALTPDDMPGFKSATQDQVMAWTGASASGVTKLLYDYDADLKLWKYINFNNDRVNLSTYAYTRNDILDYINQGNRVCYTSGSTTPAAPGKVYTGAVAITDLKVGDILCEGASITGSGSIVFDVNRVKVNGELQTEGYTYLYTTDFDSFGAEGVISLSNKSTVSPVDKDNKDGNAWEVTQVSFAENNNRINIQGTTYAAGTPLTSTDGKTWTLDKMPAGDVELQVEYEPEFTATFAAANANTIEAGKATVKVKEGDAEAVAATLTDGKLTPLYEGQKVILNATAGYKIRKVKAKKVATE